MTTYYATLADGSKQPVKLTNTQVDALLTRAFAVSDAYWTGTGIDMKNAAAGVSNWLENEAIRTPPATVGRADNASA